MNILELDNLIASLNKDTDKDLIVFYKKKRVDLLAEISNKINEGIKDDK